MTYYSTNMYNMYIYIYHIVYYTNIYMCVLEYVISIDQSIAKAFTFRQPIRDASHKPSDATTT